MLLACNVMAASEIFREPVCGDFLQQINKKSSEMIFDSCKYEETSQGKPLRVLYKVAGRDAAKVEQYLVKEFGLEELKFVCCYWESVKKDTNNKIISSGEAYYKDASNYSYYINFSSEETLFNTRAQWDKIDYFYILVTTYTVDI